jgi:hypothetical protein
LDNDVKGAPLSRIGLTNQRSSTRFHGASVPQASSYTPPIHHSPVASSRSTSSGKRADGRNRLLSQNGSNVIQNAGCGVLVLASAPSSFRQRVQLVALAAWYRFTGSQPCHSLPPNSKVVHGTGFATARPIYGTCSDDVRAATSLEKDQRSAAIRGMPRPIARPS